MKKFKIGDQVTITADLYIRIFPSLDYFEQFQGRSGKVIDLLPDEMFPVGVKLDEEDFDTFYFREEDLILCQPLTPIFKEGDLVEVVTPAWTKIPPGTVGKVTKVYEEGLHPIRVFFGEMNPTVYAYKAEELKLALDESMTECPSCKERLLIHQAGCQTCLGCGWSRCEL